MEVAGSDPAVGGSRYIIRIICLPYMCIYMVCGTVYTVMFFIVKVSRKDLVNITTNLPLMLHYACACPLHVLQRLHRRGLH